MFWGLVILFALAWVLLVLIGTAVLAHSLTHPPRHTAGGAVARGQPTDPMEAGAAAFETHSLAADDGVAMEIWDVKGADPNGPAVVMLHGWGDSKFGELTWMGPLMGAASRLILFDLRAHGESLHRRCTFGAREVKDVVKIVEWLLQTSPDCPVALFGYSMGGVVAMEAAVRCGPVVAKVIADSPYLTVDSVVAGVLRLNRLPRRPFLMLALAWLRARGILSHAGETTMPAAMLKHRLLVLHGERDAVVSMEDAQKITAASGGLMHLFDDCDHLEAIEKQPEEYARVVREFLKNETV